MHFDVWVPLENLEKIQVALKSDNNNGYFAWRPIEIYVILLNYC
jgi:hypothetical protein